MAVTAEAAPPAPEPGLWRQSLADLAPFPGRAAMTWRVALLCALVSAAAMMYEVPEAAISCYLILFLTKPDAVVNIGTGAGFLVLLIGVVAFLVWIVNLTIGSTMHIMIAIAIASFVFLYIGAASQLGEKGGVVALVIAFLLTLIVKAPFGAAATFALREAWAMAALPMALMVVFNLALGFSPVGLLRDKLRARLATAAEALDGAEPEPEPVALRELLREGNAAFDQQALSVRLLNLVPQAPGRQIARDVRASFALMLAVSALPADLAPGRRADLAAAIRAAEAALAAGEAPPAPPAPDDGATPAERAALAALAVIAGAPEAPVTPAPKIPFFAPDALTNPAYPRFALKTTAAAILCFLIYTAIDWQGIHTAMITCYVAALGTTGETVHKLALRIGGCLVGSVLGVAAIFFVIPHVDGVGALMALVFAGCLVGAWVSTGSERISYAGVQVALAFLLIVLQGFGPSLDLDTARGRIFGILLGNVVVYLIFTRVWVASIEGAVRSQLADALAALARLARVAPERRFGAVPLAAAVEALAGETAEALRLLPFDPASVRPGPAREAALRAAAVEIEALNREIWLGAGDLSAAAARLDRLSAQILDPAAGGPLTAAADDPFERRLDRLQGAFAG